MLWVMMMDDVDIEVILMLGAQKILEPSAPLPRDSSSLITHQVIHDLSHVCIRSYRLQTNHASEDVRINSVSNALF